MSESFSTINCLGYDIFSDDLNRISVKDKVLISTINQYSYCLGDKNNLFKEALKNSDILLPDGVGITAAIKLLTGIRVKKIAGADVHRYLLEKLNEVGGRCFYMGSSEETLTKIKSRIKIEYANVQVSTFSPPFKPEFTEQDDLEMIEAINAFNPHVLFIGMTAPKQEQWAYKHRNKINGIICSIGAVFDFYAQTVKRPHNIWVKVGLEWFIRLMKEPRRMSRRYLYYGPIYVWLILKIRLNDVIKTN